MISVEHADSIIASLASPVCNHQVSLSLSIGQILQEPVVADRDFPPFHRIAMDGVAISFDSWESGQRAFDIQGIQRAGDPPLTLQNKEHCIAVSTGAVLPEGCDCIVKIEDTVGDSSRISILDTVVLTRQQNIHLKGSDYPQGHTLLAPGTLIGTPEIGTLATVGQHKVNVAKRPSIGIIVTGNELVAVEDTPKDYQIRLSNGLSIQSCLTSLGYCDVSLSHINDDFLAISTGIQHALATHDVIILSGGVSAGQFDFVPKALAENNVDEKIYKIQQRPGKPMWVGQKDTTVVFGLPGNPVSSLICFYRYILPFLNTQMGYSKPPWELVQLGDTIEFKKNMTLFKPVRIANEDGQLLAYPIKLNGSGDLASLTQSDGFVECDAETTVFEKGRTVGFYKWIT